MIFKNLPFPQFFLVKGTAMQCVCDQLTAVHTHPHSTHLCEHPLTALGDLHW